MKKKSAGILAYRIKDGEPQFLLVHPGGPFYKHKDLGVWSIPKGEFTGEEEPLAAAIREFEEELGIALDGTFIQLTPITQKAGKEVHAWAIEKDMDVADMRCNTFSMEWPPKSGRMQEFPEVDRAEWFTTAEAMQKINPAQGALIEEVLNMQKDISTSGAFYKSTKRNTK